MDSEKIVKVAKRLVIGAYDKEHGEIIKDDDGLHSRTFDGHLAGNYILDSLKPSPAKEGGGLGGWRTIESAPLNTSILVFIPNAEHYGEGIYRAIHVDMGTGKRWMTTGAHHGRDLGAGTQPTHWQPLPPLPADHPTTTTGKK